jgi:uncharacterized membrane protein
LLWTVVRLIVLLACLATLFVTPIFVSSGSATSVELLGAVIDAITLVILTFAAWSLWRDRRALV